MGPKSSFVVLRHSVPPGFENRLLGPHYKNLFDKWGTQGQEGQHCPMKATFRPTPMRVPPAVSRPETILGPCTPMKHNPPRPSTMARTNLTMREPLREYIHEYIATTPQYDKQGHQIFPTYYLQDSEGIRPVYCVKAIGRGQPQNSMHQQVVVGYDY